MYELHLVGAAADALGVSRGAALALARDVLLLLYVGFATILLRQTARRWFGRSRIQRQRMVGRTWR